MRGRRDVPFLHGESVIVELTSHSFVSRDDRQCVSVLSVRRQAYAMQDRLQLYMQLKNGVFGVGSGGLRLQLRQ